MNEVTSLLGTGAALCVGAASPGPSFIMVARTAASAGRANGLNAVFLAVPALNVALKIIGGLYLSYLGFRIWRGASQPFDVSATAASDASTGRQNHLFLDLATQVSNPKTAIVYASVFAAFLPTAPSIQIRPCGCSAGVPH